MTGDRKIDSDSEWDVPAVFYRDDTPPLPPPHDPHRIEFYTQKAAPRLPSWMPPALIIVAINGIALIILLLLVR